MGKGAGARDQTVCPPGCSRRPHYVESHFARSGLSSNDHSHRRKLLKASSDIKPILSPYLELQDRSEDARYLPRDVDNNAILVDNPTEDH